MHSLCSGGGWQDVRQEHISHSTATRGTTGTRWNISLDCDASIDGYKLFRKDRMRKQGWDSGCPLCEGAAQTCGPLACD